MNNVEFLITGIAGFVGYSFAKKLSESFPDSSIMGIDNLNDYYCVKLKKARINELEKITNISFIEGDINDFDFLKSIAAEKKNIRIIFHFAAQTGIGKSVTHPFSYVKSNLDGQVSILEFAKLLPNLEKFIYASSSSVYGLSQESPFKEDIPVGKPLSLYAATKQADELMCDSYSRLFNIPMIGFRFFTVYGPWGRPDMAIYKITDAIHNNRTVKLVGDGSVVRDFTYIDDITDGIIACVNYSVRKDANGFQNEIFNLGNGRSADIKSLTYLIAKGLNKEVEIDFVDKNQTDMDVTLADISKAKELIGYSPKTNLESGLENFIKWYKAYNA